jgi:uncharacterized protein YkwD
MAVRIQPVAGSTAGAVAAAIEDLEPRLLLAASTPSVLDTYLLELINRGRADPSAEAARWGVALNEGLPAGTITTAAKQPLAFNPYLLDSAQGHSQWMLDTDTFSHTGAAGSTPMGRMLAAGYPFLAPAAAGENIAYKGTTGSYNAAAYTLSNHSGLFVDSGVSGRGHRVNLMDPAWREIGTGVKEGVFTSGSYDYNSVMVTEDFAYDATTANKSYLCGVAYADTVVADGMYTPGEGIAGVVVVATLSGTLTAYQTNAWASGAYSLLLPPGTYDIVATGVKPGEDIILKGLSIGASNVKLDLRPEMTEQQPTLTTIATLTGAKQNQNFTITYAMLAAAADEADPNPGDTIRFRVEGVTSGTLKKGAADATAGTLLGPGESLVWKPGLNAAGLQDAFTVKAWDGLLASAAAVQVEVNVGVPEISVAQGGSILVCGSLSPVDFGTAATKTPAMDLVFQVDNLGDASMVLGTLTLTNNTGFQIVQSPAATVAPGGNTTFKIRMTTTTAGNKAADVSLPSDDADENPFTFKVAGTIIVPVVGVDATTPGAAEEGPTPGTFTFTRTGPTDAPLVVHYSVKGAATNRLDYAYLSGAVTIGAGLATATVDVTPVDDARVEPAETVIVTLAGGVYGYGADAAHASATVTILDNEPLISVVAADPDAFEEGLDAAVFHITADRKVAKPLTVRYTMSGKAYNGLDYKRLAGTVTIAAGTDAADIILTAVDDTFAEGDENVILTLTATTAYTANPLAKQAAAVIHDNEPAVSIVATDPDAGETGPDKATFTVTRSVVTDKPLTVSYSVSGKAANGTDYARLAGTVTIPANQASASIGVSPVDDAKYEGPETVILTLRSATAYYLDPAQKTATATIQDNELQPDAFEEDDGPVYARPVASGAAQLRNIDNPADADWLRFTLAHAGSLTYDVDCLGAGLALAVFGPNNWTQDSHSAIITDSGTDIWAFGPGTYYIRILEDGQDSTVAGYTLTLTLS